jgi:hypothetical protein
MPVCPEKKLIFVHIPKCAGSSIEASLDIQHVKNYYSHKKCFDCMREVVDLFDGEEQERVYGVTPQHLTASQLKIIMEKTFDEYEKFTVVRNPYDRIVSEYCYIQNNIDGRFVPYHNLNFKKFIIKVFNLSEMERHLLFDSHFNTQYNFLYDKNNNLLVDHVFKFENIIEVFNRYNLSLLHERKSKRTHWKDYIDPESKNIINDYYNIDFKTFGYDKL